MKKNIVKIIFIISFVLTFCFAAISKDAAISYVRFGLSENQQNELKNVVTHFKNTFIKPSMSEFEKEMAIIMYIALTAKNDTANYFSDTLPTTALNAYGALIQGSCVCEGYADAFNLLCQASGLTSEIVIGKAYALSSKGSLEFVNHSWNRVMLDKEWYNVDIAWDDVDIPSMFILSNTYLNVTDDKFRADHKWSGGHICIAKKYGRDAIANYLFRSAYGN